MVEEQEIPIENNEVLKAIDAATGIKERVVHNKIKNSIQPTLETNPFMSKYCDVAKFLEATTTANATIYTTPTDKDFYLCSAFLSFEKDVTADNGYVSISCTAKDGTVFTALELINITLTAAAKQLSISFPYPILLKKGSTLILSGTFTVGVCRKVAGITGFTFDPTRFNTDR